MAFLSKIPKDCIELVAKDLDDFQKWAQHWQNNAWLLAKDYESGLYTAVGLAYGRAMILLYQEKAGEGLTPTKDEQEANAAEAEAIENLQSLTNTENREVLIPGPDEPSTQ